MKTWQARSSVVEHCFDVAGVSGSIPLAPTKKRQYKIEGNTYFNNKVWI